MRLAVIILAIFIIGITAVGIMIASRDIVEFEQSRNVKGDLSAADLTPAPDELALTKRMDRLPETEIVPVEPQQGDDPGDITIERIEPQQEDNPAEIAIERNAPQQGDDPGEITIERTAPRRVDGPSEIAIERIEPQQADDSKEIVVERIEPRQPLSELSLALPPKRSPTPLASASPEQFSSLPGITLYRPVATSSAKFEVMNRIISVAGVDDVMHDERCTYEGQEWDCGIHARTAVRAFIRGRAITCFLSPTAPKEVSAECRVGTQDVGSWLVNAGWARAVPGSHYSELERKAREAKLGIFGPAPAPENSLDQVDP